MEHVEALGVVSSASHIPSGFCAGYRRPARGTPRCTWRYWTGRIWWYASLGHRRRDLFRKEWLNDNRITESPFGGEMVAHHTIVMVVPCCSPPSANVHGWSWVKYGVVYTDMIIKWSHIMIAQNHRPPNIGYDLDIQHEQFCRFGGSKWWPFYPILCITVPVPRWGYLRGQSFSQHCELHWWNSADVGCECRLRHQGCRSGAEFPAIYGKQW